MSSLLDHVKVVETGDRQFDDGWHPVHQGTMKVMRGLRASLRLANTDGRGRLVLVMANALPSMTASPRRAVVFVNGRQVEEFEIDSETPEKVLVDFDPVATDEIEVTLAIDRLLSPDGGSEGEGYGLALFEARLVESKVVCMEPWTTTYITWDGRVRSCCFSQADLGSVHENTIDEVWDGETYVHLRDALAIGDVPTECALCVDNQRQKFELFSTAKRIGMRQTICDKHDYLGDAPVQ